MTDLIRATGAEVRAACRRGTLTGPTPGLAMGHVQANLVIVPQELAYDFLLFCQRNPKPCPLLDVTEPGDPEPKWVAPGADLRTDLPRYRIYRNGELAEEPTDILKVWRDDLVSFVIGCSFTFENALLEAGVPVRHLEMNRNVPMYRTNIPCRSAGQFAGPLVVSMRPLTPEHALTAARICVRDSLVLMGYRFILAGPARLESVILTSRITVIEWTLIQKKYRCSGPVASLHKRRSCRRSCRL